MYMPASDLELVRQIEAALSATGRPDLSALRVRAKEGALTISGQASCWYARQLAVACVLRYADGVRVEDEIEVVARQSSRAKRDE